MALANCGSDDFDSTMPRILVIEDSPVNMALTVAILHNAGHSATRLLRADPKTAALPVIAKRRNA